MNPQTAGILLSPEVFHAAWFECLAAFVAFNTLIYVGLTLAKLIPWPRIMRPVEIRERVERTFRRSRTTSPSRTAVPQAVKGGGGSASRRLPTPGTRAEPAARFDEVTSEHDQP